MGSLGPFEIVLIFLVILLIFGAKRIPEIARGLGRGIREFKDATGDIKRELTLDDNQPRIHSPRQGAPASRQASYQAPPPQPTQAANPAAPDETASQAEGTQPQAS